MMTRDQFYEALEHLSRKYAWPMIELHIERLTGQRDLDRIPCAKYAAVLEALGTKPQGLTEDQQREHANELRRKRRERERGGRPARHRRTVQQMAEDRARERAALAESRKRERAALVEDRAREHANERRRQRRAARRAAGLPGNNPPATSKYNAEYHRAYYAANRDKINAKRRAAHAIKRGRS